MFLSIWGGLVSGALWIPKSTGAHIPELKWCRTMHTVGPPHLHTPNCRLKTIQVFIAEKKNPGLSGSMQFKPVLSKGQLYLITPAHWGKLEAEAQLDLLCPWVPSPGLGSLALLIVSVYVCPYVCVQLSPTLKLHLHLLQGFILFFLKKLLVNQTVSRLKKIFGDNDNLFLH